MIKLVLVIFLAVPSSVFATQCKESVSLLNEGEKAPCTGFLFSPEAEKLATIAHEDAKYFKEYSGLLEEKLNKQQEQLMIMDERLNLYMSTSHELAKEMNRKDREDFWQKTIYFGLGVLATSIAIYGATQLD